MQPDISTSSNRSNKPTWPPPTPNRSPSPSTPTKSAGSPFRLDMISQPQRGLHHPAQVLARSSCLAGLLQVSNHKTRSSSDLGYLFSNSGDFSPRTHRPI